MTPEELAAAEKAAWALFPGGECDHANADGVCLLCAAEVVRAGESRGHERGIKEAARVALAHGDGLSGEELAEGIRDLLSGNAAAPQSPTEIKKALRKMQGEMECADCGDTWSSGKPGRCPDCGAEALLPPEGESDWTPCLTCWLGAHAHAAGSAHETGMAVAENASTPAADHGGHGESHQHRLRKPEHADVVARPPVSSPIDMVLRCPNPKCGLQHVDAPEPGTDWTNPPHKSHQCHGCGIVWRPADVPTNGVAAIATRGTADTWPPKETPQ